MSIFNIYTLITGSKFFWKIIRNWKVLSEALAKIGEVLKEVKDSGSLTPNTRQSQDIMLSVSNILKTGVIDFPGVDEYEISVSIDQIYKHIQLSIKDSKSEKFHKITLKKKE